jgi:hypothetical protein
LSSGQPRTTVLNPVEVKGRECAVLSYNRPTTYAAMPCGHALSPVVAGCTQRTLNHAHLYSPTAHHYDGGATVHHMRRSSPWYTRTAKHSIASSGNTSTSTANALPAERDTAEAAGAAAAGLSAGFTAACIVPAPLSTQRVERHPPLQAPQPACATPAAHTRVGSADSHTLRSLISPRCSYTATHGRRCRRWAPTECAAA